MKSLKQNLTSQYWGAAQKLQSKRSRRKIIAYVESYEDVAFWRQILSRLEDETRYFQVMLPDARTLTKGKKQALMTALRHIALGGNIIACVDSDYDYLLQDATYTSRQLNRNPYIFQTYTYAIESYHCYAPSLRDVCTTATLNDHFLVDIPRLLENYSRIVYPLFLWNVYFYRLRHEGQFSITDFNQATMLESAELGDKFGRSLQRLENRVKQTLQRLRKKHPADVIPVKKLGTELEELGIQPEETYLYIQGHHLMDHVVLPILSPVCKRLRSFRENEIQRLAINPAQRQNELSSYRHAITPLEEALRKNFQFTDLPHYQRLFAELEERLGKDRETDTSPQRQ